MSFNSGDVPIYIKYLFASASGMCATSICFPMDIIRLRMQLVGEGVKGKRDTTISFTRKLYQTQGLETFYNGISAAVLRQFLYTGARLGTFQYLMDQFKRWTD